MSLVRIWVHIIFATKDREPLLTRNVRYAVQNHIIENCEKKDIFLQTINGHVDHLHCLVSLKSTQTISNVTKLIKGESSIWINNNLLENSFQWQDKYAAFSVSESNVQRVINYIKNQEIHHLTKSFDDEMEDLLNSHGMNNGPVHRNFRP